MRHRKYPIIIRLDLVDHFSFVHIITRWGIYYNIINDSAFDIRNTKRSGEYLSQDQVYIVYDGCLPDYYNITAYKYICAYGILFVLTSRGVCFFSNVIFKYIIRLHRVRKKRTYLFKTFYRLWGIGGEGSGKSVVC